MHESPGSPEPFSWSSVAAGDEHHALALELYNAGRTFPQIASALQAQGLPPDQLSDVIVPLAKNRATHQLVMGKSRAKIEQILIDKGMNPDEAKAIVSSADRDREKTFAAMGLGKWKIRSLIAGGILLVAGLVLHAVGGPMAHEGVVAVLLGLGVLLSGVGGVYIMFDMG